MFFGMKKLAVPEDWKAVVGEENWIKGKSAYELAHAWQLAGGFPASVREVLRGSDALASLEIRRGIVECPVGLDTNKSPSMTDIMLYCSRGEDNAVLAVEGKADERFDKLTSKWLDAATAPTRERRLAFLCDVLGLDQKAALGLMYQLLHRTASAVLEASSCGAALAGVIVHSFSSQEARNWEDYAAFLRALGVDAPTKNRVDGPVMLARNAKRSMPTYFAWVDEVRR